MVQWAKLFLDISGIFMSKYPALIETQTDFESLPTCLYGNNIFYWCVTDVFKAVEWWLF